MFEADYIQSYRTLSIANVDAPTGQLGHCGHVDIVDGGRSLGSLKPFETRRVWAIVEDVIVPGHNLLPVDRSTGRLLSLYGTGHVNWGLAYPGPAAFQQVPIPGLVWAVAPVRNYYHLLVEHILPVIDALLREPDIYRGRTITAICPPNVLVVRYFVSLMSQIGIKIDLVEANPFATYVPERYLLCKPVSSTVEHYYCYRETIEILKKQIVKTPLMAGSSRLYIPRTSTRIRHLDGEALLVERLAKLGFEPFVATWSNIDEQISRFMTAREIVSVHGAALTNMIWAPDGAQVTEMFPANARKTTYLHIASQHNHAYACLLGSVEDDRQNFSIDFDRVITSLQDRNAG